MTSRIFNVGSVRFRFTVLVIFLVLLAAALVNYVSFHLAERQMRAVVGDQQFALLSSAAAYIDDDLGAKQTVLMVLREQLAHGGDQAPDSIQGFLEAHATLRDEFFNVGVLDHRGDLVANLNDRRAIGRLNFSKRDYFTATVKNREGMISQPFKSLLSGEPVVAVTEPVLNAAGKLLYVLVGVIDVQRPRFFGQLDALKLGKSGYLFMLTTDGTIIHHPDKQRILQSVTAEEGGAVRSTLAAMNGFEGWTEGKSKRGVQALLTYKRLKKTDWIIGSVYPVSEAFAPLIEARKNAVFASAGVAIIAGLIGWLAIIRLLKPLGALRRHIARLSDGSANIEVFDVARKDEFGELSRAFFMLSKQRRHAERDLAALARTDPLTGIPNRRMFEEVFEAALARAGRNRGDLALAFLDIDHFKHINDTHGHGIGDQVLVEFAQRIALGVRATDTVARLAGDEFVVIFEGLRRDEEVAALAQKILACLRPAFLVGELALTVTASVGIAVNAQGSASADELMEESDQALYAAKSAGRNGYVVRRVCRPVPTHPSQKEQADANPG